MAFLSEIHRCLRKMLVRQIHRHHEVYTQERAAVYTNVKYWISSLCSNRLTQWEQRMRLLRVPMEVRTVQIWWLPRWIRCEDRTCSPRYGWYHRVPRGSIGLWLHLRHVPRIGIFGHQCVDLLLHICIRIWDKPGKLCMFSDFILVLKLFDIA